MLKVEEKISGFDYFDCYTSLMIKYLGLARKLTLQGKLRRLFENMHAKQEQLNPQSDNHDCSRRHSLILFHRFSEKIRLDISSESSA